MIIKNVLLKGLSILLTFVSLSGLNVSADEWHYCPAATKELWVMTDNGCSDSFKKIASNDTAAIALSGIGASIVGVGAWPVLFFGPDELDPITDFGASCSRHDVCYGTLGETRKSCDTAFLNDMRRSCNDKYKDTLVSPSNCNKVASIIGIGGSLACHTVRELKVNPLRAHCRGVAQIYYEFVNKIVAADWRDTWNDRQAFARSAQEICDKADQTVNITNSPKTCSGLACGGGPPCPTYDVGISCDGSGHCNEAFGRACTNRGGNTRFNAWNDMVCVAPGGASKCSID